MRQGFFAQKANARVESSRVESSRVESATLHSHLFSTRSLVTLLGSFCGFQWSLPSLRRAGESKTSLRCVSLWRGPQVKYCFSRWLLRRRQELRGRRKRNGTEARTKNGKSLPPHTCQFARGTHANKCRSFVGRTREK